jgi:hypothetical protein
MFESIWNGIKKGLIFIGFMNHPDGYGQWYSMNVRLKSGYGTRKKIAKTLNKGFDLFDVPSSVRDETIESTLENNYMEDEVWYQTFQRNSDNYHLDRLVPGVEAVKFKNILEKANVGFVVSLRNQTSWYNDNAVISRQVSSIKQEYAHAMDMQDFEKAAIAKKKLGDLQGVLNANSRNIRWIDLEEDC